MLSFISKNGLPVAMALAALASTVTASGVAEERLATKVVFLRGNDIWVAAGDGSDARRLTTDGKPKGPPVWSPAGDRIAFHTAFDLRATPNAEMVVLDEQGKVLRTLPITAESTAEPVEINSILAFDWIDERRIGYQGHLNPSFGEYRVIDLELGRQVASYLGSRFTWSPGGGRLAYVGWTPHFQPESTRNEYVEIDGKAVYSSLDDPVAHQILSDLAWSPDGLFLAFVARLRTGRSELVVVENGALRQRQHLPAPVTRAVWLANDALAVVGSEHLWKASPHGGELVALEEEKEAALRRSLSQAVAGPPQWLDRAGGRDADWWPGSNRPSKRMP
jgi:hypothetical protein